MSLQQTLLNRSQLSDHKRLLKRARNGLGEYFVLLFISMALDCENIL